MPRCVCVAVHFSVLLCVLGCRAVLSVGVLRNAILCSAVCCSVAQVFVSCGSAVEERGGRGSFLFFKECLMCLYVLRTHVFFRKTFWDFMVFSKLHTFSH